MPHHVDESPVYGTDYGDEDIINSLNGSVHAAGIKIDIRAWLDIGSKDWQNTTDDDRKKAFIAARKSGWSKNSLKGLMLRNYAHLSEAILDHVFEILETE